MVYMLPFDYGLKESLPTPPPPPPLEKTVRDEKIYPTTYLL